MARAVLLVPVFSMLASSDGQESAPIAAWGLERVAVIATAAPGAEIVSVQAGTRRAALTHSQAGAVELYDLADPARPRSLGTIALELAEGEELTSVALPPQGDYFLSAVKAAGPLDPGRVVAHALAGGKRLASFPCGVGPDCVAIDAAGRFALVANEAEGFESVDGEPTSAAGSVTRIELAAELERSSVLTIDLADLGERPELDDPAGRFIERSIAGRKRLLPLGRSAAFLEPEVVTFAPHGRRAYVSLQESNAVLVLDVERASVLQLWSLGTSTHPADLLENGAFAETGPLLARREPDGIALTPDGRYLVSADEGDTFPKAKETPQGVPAGGARSVSVFDAATGTLVGDTGPELDRTAAAAGLYPDKRSGEKGCEPEMVVCFELDGRAHAAVTLERAGALALIDLGDPSRPRVLSVCALGDDPPADEPEGLAHLHDAEHDTHYLYAANEGTGTLGVLAIR
jgi:hypothetical protein